MTGAIDIRGVFDLVGKRMSGSRFDLPPDFLPSAAITSAFASWLRNEDLKVSGASAPQLDLAANTVTLSGGTGASFAFQGAPVTVIFTIADGEPQMTVTAKLEDGEQGTFSAAFPSLAGTFFDDVSFTSHSTLVLRTWSGGGPLGLQLDGALALDGALTPISTIFNGLPSLSITAALTIDDDRPVFSSVLQPSAQFTVGSLPQLTMTMSMDVSKTSAVLAVNSAVPYGSGATAGVLKIGTVYPFITGNDLLLIGDVTGTIDFGLAVVSQLFNAIDVRSLLPQQLTPPASLRFDAWQLGIDFSDGSLDLLSLGVTYVSPWDLVPGYVTVESIGFSLTVQPSQTPSVTVTASAELSLAPDQPPPDDGRVQLQAIYPGFAFSGFLEPDSRIRLAPLLQRFFGDVPGAFQDMAVDTLSFAVDPASANFFLEVGIEIGWTVTIGGIGFSLDSVAVQFQRSAGATRGSIAAVLAFPDLADLRLDCSASYDSTTSAWLFRTALDPTQNFPIGALIQKYAPSFSDFPLSGLVVNQFSASMQTGSDSWYGFDMTVTYQLEPGGGAPPIATLATTLQIRIGATKSAVISGTLGFYGIVTTFRISLASGKSPIISVTFFGITSTIQNGVLTITFSNGVTLGQLITTLVEAATGDTISLPPPFNALNSINLDDFEFIFDFTKKTASLVYTPQPSIDLGFMSIEAMELTYDASGGGAGVTLSLTKGTFLGKSTTKTWDVTDPGSMAADVPGAGSSVLDVHFVAIGQRVLPSQPFPSNVTVSTAIAQLEKDFLQSPLSGGSLQFNDGAGWLIGVDLTIVKTFRLQGVFIDPLLYGAALTVNGPQGAIFNGLAFEILYKRVSDSVGVYQIELTLPTAFRYFDIGAMSVTLPIIGVDIYTNGDFLIDFGFPTNGDFSGSFGLQMLPFTGAGGFYFGMLSSGTANHLPPMYDPVPGAFAPVIVFGIGIQVGFQESVSYGIMSAGISLTVQGIVEGTVAFYHPYPGNLGEGDRYYWIQGTIQIVGHLWGSIDFAIASARLDVTITIGTIIVIVRHEPINVTFTASVTVSITVSINLGLFSIDIDLSFSASISESFQIGSQESSPWGPPVLTAARGYLPDVARRFPARTLGAGSCPAAVTMQWQPILLGNEPRRGVPLLLVPQITAASDVDADGNVGSAKPQIVTALFVQTNDPAGGVPPFSVLAEGVLLWAINAYLNAGKSVTLDALLAQPITAEDLSNAYCGILQKNAQLQPFLDTELHDFVSTFFELTISVPPPAKPGDPPRTVGFMPMFPDLTLAIPGATPFSFGGFNMTSTDTLAQIEQYFAQLDPTGKAAVRTAGSVQLSMATFLFMDYFQGLARNTVQTAIDIMGGPTEEAGGRSLRDIAGSYPMGGFGVRDVARANLTRRLRPGMPLTIPHRGRTHEVTGDSRSTLLGIARDHGVDALALAEANADVPDFFAAVRILVPPPASITVAGLLAKMTYSDIAGNTARAFLAGLRPPYPTLSDAPQALYTITGQQFEATPLLTAPAVLSVDATNLPWLAFGTPQQKAASLDISLSADEQNIVSAFDGIVLQPKLAEFAQGQLYDTRPRQFTLANAIVWETSDLVTPRPQRLVAGDDLVSPTIWSFPADLLAVLADPAIPPPRVELVEQLQDAPHRAPFRVGSAVTAAPHVWCTTFEVAVRTSPDPGDPGKVLPSTYELIGAGASDAALLQSLLQYWFDHGEPDLVDSIYILFAPDPAAPAVPHGLASDPIAETDLFLVQTNLSTVSNPASLPRFAFADAPGNLLGQEPMAFLSRVWECSIVQSGGYDLYYRETKVARGLPPYLFDDATQTTLTVVVTYKITDDVLLPFVNTVVVRQPVQPETTTFYVQALDGDLVDQIPIVAAGNVTFAIDRDAPSATQFRGGEVAEEDAQAGLQQLFNLVSYRIDANATFGSSPFGLPLGPTKSSVPDPDPNAVRDTTAWSSWPYTGVVPVARFASSPTIGGPPPANDPYRGVGGSAEIEFAWLDVFGNRIATANTGLGDPFSLTCPVLYFDPLIGIDQWPSTNAAYSFSADRKLLIVLSFDASPYLGKVELSGEKTPGDLAASDSVRYAAAWYQLNRSNTAVALNTTIDVTTETENAAAKAALVQYLGAVWGFLQAVVSGGTPAPPVNVTMSRAVADSNPEDLYELAATVTIRRTSDVDPAYAKPPYSVSSVTTTVRPDVIGTTRTVKRRSVRVPGSAPNVSAPLTLQQFATDLQTAFPGLEVLTTRSGNPNDAGAGQMWVARFGAGGMSFTIDPASAAWFFGLPPLATEPQSIQDVPIYGYVSGQYIATETPLPHSFSNVDLQLLAQTFADALETVLSPQFVVPAWEAVAGASLASNPIDDILSAKRTIAHALASTLTGVLGSQVDPPADRLQAAITDLEQRLLVHLTDAFTFDTVVQYGVSTTSQYADSNDAPRLYGTPVVPDGTTAALPKQFALTNTRFALRNAPPQQYFSFFFSTGDAAAAAKVDLPLHFKPTYIEMPLQEVKALGYRPSRWLAFVLPFDAADLGTPGIPVPLRVYPTPPSLALQTATPTFPAPDSLAQVRQWTFTWGYDYAAADQDTIHTLATFNTPAQKLARDADIDTASVLAALLQFSSNWTAIQADLVASLVNRTDPKLAVDAIRSFAWIASQVAAVWPSQAAEMVTGTGGSTYAVAIHETAATVDQTENVLVAEITADEEAGEFVVPAFTIPSFTTEKVVVQGAPPDTYAFIQNGLLLDAGAGRDILRRILDYGGLDVLRMQNGVAAVSVRRNETLGGEPANPAFVYRTPLIAANNVVTPLLDSSLPIDLATYSSAPPKPLVTYLQAFLADLFGTATGFVATIGGSFQYDLILQTDALAVTVPIFLTTPLDPLDPAFASGVAGAVDAWVVSHALTKTTGLVQFDLSVYSGLSNVQLPILRLRDVFVATGDVVWGEAMRSAGVPPADAQASSPAGGGAGTETAS